MPLNHVLSRILLIEDDIDDCEVFRWAIEDISPHIQLEICNNCIVAADTLSRFAPDIIFLDLKLPYKKGIDYLEELGSKHYQRHPRYYL